MKRKIIAIYSILIGFSVIGMWLMILNTQTLPEGKIELTFHLFSEFLMATVCIVGGFLKLMKARFARSVSIAGFSMLVYSVLNVAGYYGERGETAMMAMFVVLFILSLIASIILITEKKRSHVNH
jgi:hypothetical protein